MIFPQESDYPRENLLISFLRAIGFFLFYYAVRTVVFSAATIFFTIKYKEPSMAEKAYLENANMLSFLCGIIIILSLIFFFKGRGERVVTAMHVRKPAASVVILAFFAGASLNFSTNFALSLLPKSLIDSYVEAASSAQESTVLWYVLAAVLMAPVVEELIFRAMMVPRLSTSVGNAVAIVAVSAVFGSIHGHIVWSSYAFLLGLVLGFAFIRSRSIIVSIAMHVGFNLVSLTSYIDPGSLSERGIANLNVIFEHIYAVSVPVSALLILLFIEKTKKTSSRAPIGLDENPNEGDI